LLSAGLLCAAETLAACVVQSLVFMLWGKPAQKKAKNINTSRHLVLEVLLAPWPHFYLYYLKPSCLLRNPACFACRHKSVNSVKLTLLSPILCWVVQICVFDDCLTLLMTPSDC
jgi:hypothetical protein